MTEIYPNFPSNNFYAQNINYENQMTNVNIQDFNYHNHYNYPNIQNEHQFNMYAYGNMHGNGFNHNNPDSYIEPSVNYSSQAFADIMEEVNANHQLDMNIQKYCVSNRTKSAPRKKKAPLKSNLLGLEEASLNMEDSWDPNILWASTDSKIIEGTIAKTFVDGTLPQFDLNKCTIFNAEAETDELIEKIFSSSYGNNKLNSSNTFSRLPEKHNLKSELATVLKAFVANTNVDTASSDDLDQLIPKLKAIFTKEKGPVIQNTFNDQQGGFGETFDKNLEEALDFIPEEFNCKANKSLNNSHEEFNNSEEIINTAGDRIDNYVENKIVTSMLDRLMEEDIQPLKEQWDAAGCSLKKLNKYIYGSEVNWDIWDDKNKEFPAGVKYLYNENQREETRFVSVGPTPETLSLRVSDFNNFVYLSICWTDTRWHCSPVRLTVKSSDDDILDLWVKSERDISGLTTQHTGLSYKNGWYKHSTKIARPSDLVTEEECCQLFIKWLKKRNNPIVVAFQKNCHDSNSIFRLMRQNNLTVEFSTSVRGFVSASKLLKSTECKFYDGPDIFKAKMSQLKDLEEVEKCSYTINFLKEFFNYSRQCRVRWCSMNHFFKDCKEPFMDYSHSLRLAHAGFDYDMLKDVFHFGGSDGLIMVKKIANRNDFCGNYIMKPKQISVNIIRKMGLHFQNSDLKNSVPIESVIRSIPSKKLTKRIKSKPDPCVLELESGRLPTSLVYNRFRNYS